MKTELNTRTLWFDGTNQVSPDDVPSLILSGCSLDKIIVNELNDDIKQFNLLEELQIETAKSENGLFNLDYNIPKEYQTLDVEYHLFLKVDGMPHAYEARLEAELVEIKKRDMVTLLRTLIHIVDTFKKSGTVWGVGRGSSCASLVLFLIGLHKVDPIKFGIPMSEFFHD